MTGDSKETGFRKGEDLRGRESELVSWSFFLER
jgi:hypothetical protein